MPELITLSQVADMLGISKSTFHRIRKDYDFPKAVVVGKRERWLLHDIAAWVRR